MTTAVLRRVTAVVAGAVLALPLSTLPAQASRAPLSISAAVKAPPTKCWGGTGSGRCLTLKSTTRKKTVVETVPLKNTSKHTGTFTCSFSRTITRQMTKTSQFGASTQVEAGFSMVKASVKVEASVSRTVSQTGAEATQAGVSVKLKPGQKATCKRTYGYVAARFSTYTWRSNKASKPKVFTSNVPSHIGITLAK